MSIPASYGVRDFLKVYEYKLQLRRNSSCSSWFWNMSNTTHEKRVNIFQFSNNVPSKLFTHNSSSAFTPSLFLCGHTVECCWMSCKIFGWFIEPGEGTSLQSIFSTQSTTGPYGQTYIIVPTVRSLKTSRRCPASKGENETLVDNWRIGRKFDCSCSIEDEWREIWSAMIVISLMVCKRAVTPISFTPRTQSIPI